MADLPFVVEPAGDPALAAEAAAAAAHRWRLPDPVLIRSGMNALFAAGDDVVLRVGRPTAEPRAAVWLAAELARHGIRVPRHTRPDPYVHPPFAVFAVVRERSVGPVDWRGVGEMVARLHRIDPRLVVGHHPAPPCSSFPWWDFDRLLDDVGDLLDRPARRGIEAALHRHRGWASRGERIVLCHGDVHPGNVIQTADGPALLDWDLLCVGPIGWDHGPLMTWTERWGGEPGIYDAFAAGYGRSLRGDPVAEAVAELRLVAATLMRLRAGRHDERAATEAAARLRYWRGDPDAPAWRAA